MNSALFWLRFIHTLVFAYCIATLIPMSAYALTGEGERVALIGLIGPVLVFLGLMLNRGTCILQTLAKRLTGTTDGWVRDIFFLPESWALQVVKVMLPVFVLVIGGVGLRFATTLG
ncbi:hypothetical protein [Maricaulis sp.]|uniref:hypothetical protein n=1 Tax=Maricaulis sp. TaxID=1486257 RepID=UPI002607DD91|nr:hypothetical protein [Maricaulis sp.]